MPKLAVAMLSHEGNSFSPVPTTLSNFRTAVWCAGDAVAAAFRGTPSEMGGVVAFLDTRPDWEARFLRVAQATPGGVLVADAYEEIVDEIVTGLSGPHFDAVYLALHGALMAEGRDLADLDLIRRVRATIGPDAVLGVSFDLHANLDPAIASLVDVASGYKTHPHVDQFDTAIRVLGMVDRTLAGEIRPVGSIAKTDTILPSINMRTDAGPMAEIEAQARAMIGGRIIEAVPFGGFSYADTVAAGASAMVFADGDAEEAAAAASALCEAIETRRDAFFTPLPDPTQAIVQALQAIAGGAGKVAIADAGDNPLSGGIADTPELLRALVAAAPSVSVLVAYYCDAQLAARASNVGVGGRIEGELGGRLTHRFGEPVPFAATVTALGSGRFAASPPLICGPWIDFGPLVLLRLDGIDIHIIVSSTIASPHDPGLLAALDIDLAAFDLVAIKAKNHFRAAYAGQFATIITCDSPGPAALDISSFRFERAPAHLYPLSRSAA